MPFRPLADLIDSARRRVVGGATTAQSTRPAADELRGIATEDRIIIERVLPYTMTGVARVASLIDAVRYCVQRGVEGSFVECGVWRGGSVLTMVLTLQQIGADDREIYLYDTFEGMSEPTAHDLSDVAPPALSTWHEALQRNDQPWGDVFSSEVFDEHSVRETVLSTGYRADLVHVVRGPVEQTLPDQAPERIALLRLDTDWYASTRHEMEHLYPRLEHKGVLIIDDYGHWEGARRAVDEYFSARQETLLLGRIDYTARMAVKP